MFVKNISQMNRRIPYCGECSFFNSECVDGFGYCPISDHSVHCEDVCYLDDHTTISPSEIVCGLHHYQKWRRGSKDRQPQPYVIGKLIDAAIYRLRNI